MERELAPSWLELLLDTQFFTTCTSHLLSSRNECNLFCVDCEVPPAAFCYYCRSRHHSTHRVIQIRRSSYHDVVRVSELEGILDISDVQTYVINSARVVFLNERPQPRGCGVSVCKPLSSLSYYCETCGRALLDAFRFCSLGCNVRGIKEDIMNTTMAGEDLELDGKAKATNANASGLSPGSKIEKSNNDNVDKEPPTKKARHRRKGIPRRAPFF
ncbi:hypothetical protein ACP4OV_011437 [Aristida adscensionis]